MGIAVGILLLCALEHETCLGVKYPPAAGKRRQKTAVGTRVNLYCVLKLLAIIHVAIWLNLTQSAKPLNRSSPKTPFVPPVSWSCEDWGGSVSKQLKTTCPRLLPSRIVRGMTETRTQDLSARKPER